MGRDKGFKNGILEYSILKDVERNDHTQMHLDQECVHSLRTEVDPRVHF